MMAAEATQDRTEVGRRRRAARWPALRLALIYAVAAGLWIILSNSALSRLGLSRDLERQLSSAKGTVFVLVTATILFLLALRFLHDLEAAQERYTRPFEIAGEGLTVFRVVRGRDGALTDVELTDVYPNQEARTGLTREQVVGQRLSRPDDLDERTRSYLEVVAAAAGSGVPSRTELYVENDDAYELVEVHPIGPDRWALAALDVSGVHRAKQTLRRPEESIRRAYVDVLDAVTGGKLILLTEDEVAAQLGTPLTEPAEVTAPEQLELVRRGIVAVAVEHFPDLAPEADLRTPVCEALANALKHAGGGTYQLFSTDGRLQVVVTDVGPGIDFHTLPRATLVSGFSTVSSLGMGFTIMLQSCERVLLSTRPGRTTVVLELATTKPPTRLDSRGGRSGKLVCRRQRRTLGQPRTLTSLTNPSTTAR